MSSEEFTVTAFIMRLQKRWDHKCFNSAIMSLWWNPLYKTSQWEHGWLCGAFCTYAKNVIEHLFLTVWGGSDLQFSRIRTTLSRSSSVNLRALPRTRVLIEGELLLADIFNRNRTSFFSATPKECTTLKKVDVMSKMYFLCSRNWNHCRKNRVLS